MIIVHQNGFYPGTHEKVVFSVEEKKKQEEISLHVKQGNLPDGHRPLPTSPAHLNQGSLLHLNLYFPAYYSARGHLLLQDSNAFFSLGLLFAFSNKVLWGFSQTYIRFEILKTVG
jgi:hypothetical protein